MQVTGELLARFFVHLDHALFLFDQVLVQAGVLNGDHRMPANDI